MNEKSWQPTASNESLLARALMMRNIRAFFDSRGVVEVETPLLSHYATTDPHLDSLQSRFREQRCYLNTSPEYAMKRLLAYWKKPVYQTCKAFRDDELGPDHNPEFTLLEWYQPGYDMASLMNELAELVTVLCRFSASSTAVDRVQFESLSYQQAFENFTGINPHTTTSGECHRYAIANNIEIPLGLGPADDVNNWLDWLLMQRVVPGFNKACFTFLYDYPAAQCALAKIAENEHQYPVAKRFELFFGGIELANGFHELTDAAEQLKRFQSENERRKQLGKQPGKIDENFIAALDYGLPECAGVAMGLDRLLMVLMSYESIKQVLSFSWESA